MRLITLMFYPVVAVPCPDTDFRHADLVATGACANKVSAPESYKSVLVGEFRVRISRYGELDKNITICSLQKAAVPRRADLIRVGDAHGNFAITLQQIKSIFLPFFKWPKQVLGEYIHRWRNDVVVVFFCFGRVVGLAERFVHCGWKLPFGVPGPALDRHYAMEQQQPELEPKSAAV